MIVSHQFKYGDKNDNVKLLQRALRECLKADITVDGAFGNQTTACLKQYQQELGLDVTGLYEGQTKKVTDEYISKRFIQPWCYGYVAKLLGRDEGEFTAIAKAIASVESRASGFNADGSLTILFERHKFYSQLLEALNSDPNAMAHVVQTSGVPAVKYTAQSLVDAVAAKYPDICNKKSGGYVGGIKEHERLKRACDIHPMAGIASASYGLYQIMGFNAKLCGYKNADEMHTFMLPSEINHLIVFGKFLEASPNMYKFLQRRDYASMAKLYNGSGYEKNNYDTKLKAALAAYGY